MYHHAKNLLAASLIAALAAAPFALPAHELAQHDASGSSMSTAAQSSNETVPGKINDLWISTKVKSSFATTSGVDASDVHVATSDGHVTLTGQVASSAERVKAAQVAYTVTGVKSVDISDLRSSGASANAYNGSGSEAAAGSNGNAAAMNDGQPASSSSSSSSSQSLTGAARDAWITTKIKSSYATTQGVDATDISVSTHNGTVMLSGTVANSAEKNKAVRIARGIDGVKHVTTSGLSIGNSHARAAAAAGAGGMVSSAASAASKAGSDLTGAAKDTWITTKIKSEYATNSGVDATDISVTTRDGRVMLSGTVADRAEQAKAERLARGIDGVKGIDASGLRISGSSAGSPSGAMSTAPAASPDAGYDGSSSDISSETPASSGTSGESYGRDQATDMSHPSQAASGQPGMDGAQQPSGSSSMASNEGAGNSGDSTTTATGAGLTGAASDTWISSRVKAEFASTGGEDAKNISISTKNGVVILSGSVANAADKATAARVAQQVRGVKSVDTAALSVDNPQQ